MTRSAPARPQRWSHVHVYSSTCVAKYRPRSMTSNDFADEPRVSWRERHLEELAPRSPACGSVLVAFRLASCDHWDEDYQILRTGVVKFGDWIRSGSEAKPKL